MHPQRPKLADHICVELRDGIESRRWLRWLPQERVLARDLHISRATLRQATQRLRSEGLLEPLRGQGYRILGRPVRRSRPPRPLTVNLVLPDESQRLLTSAVNWVDQLRAELAGRGCQLRVLHAGSCYAKRSARLLEKLVRRNPADCWLVRLSTQSMQEWFQASGLPVVLAGSGYADIALPCVDVDHCAMSRHSAGMVLGAGHRRVAFLVERNLKAGDVAARRGFLEATRAAAQEREIQASVVEFEGGADGMVRSLDHLLKLPQRPTAIIVAHAIYCLTIWSHLGSRGVRVPHDMAVVAHNGLPHLSFLRPEPAHYRLDIGGYVQRLQRAVLARIAGRIDVVEQLMLPEFVRGGSLRRLGSAELKSETTG